MNFLVAKNGLKNHIFNWNLIELLEWPSNRLHPCTWPLIFSQKQIFVILKIVALLQYSTEKNLKTFYPLPINCLKNQNFFIAKHFVRSPRMLSRTVYFSWNILQILKWPSKQPLLGTRSFEFKAENNFSWFWQLVFLLRYPTEKNS